MRPHVATFYAFARAIDDIADGRAAGREDRPARRVRSGAAERTAGRSRLCEGARDAADAGRDRITPRHCLDLVSAFKQDATKLRYADWPELIDYCNRSAAPVGRFLLDLHGGSRDGYAPSDALYNALQVINHLQDCQDDLRTLDRVYLPTKWLEEEGRRWPTWTGRRCRRRCAG